MKKRFPIIRCPDIAPPPASLDDEQYEAMRRSYEAFIKSLFVHNAFKDSSDAAQILGLPTSIKSTC